jgi:hypothetical protein
MYTYTHKFLSGQAGAAAARTQRHTKHTQTRMIRIYIYTYTHTYLHGTGRSSGRTNPKTYGYEETLEKHGHRVKQIRRSNRCQKRPNTQAKES